MFFLRYTTGRLRTILKKITITMLILFVCLFVIFYIYFIINIDQSDGKISELSALWFFPYKLWHIVWENISDVA